MAIEITEFADVSISVSPVGVSSGNFGILGFLAVDAVGQALAGQEILVAERTRAYTSLASVGLDWESDSEAYLAAVAFYSQTPTPRDFVVLVQYLGETTVEALTASVAKGTEFVGLVLSKSLRDVTTGVGDTTVEVGQWAEAAKKIFMNTTNDANTLLSAQTGDVASLLQAETGLRFTHTCYSSVVAQYPSAAVFGRAASVNFASSGSTITLNLKQLSGVTAQDLTPAEFAAMRAKHCSAVVVIGSSVNAFVDSRMASGSWLDTTHGLMWLESRIEADLFNLIYTSGTKVPFSQVGINTTVGVLERALQAAVRNGLCGAGFLADGTFLPEGYSVSSVALADVPAGDLGARTYKGLSFVLKGVGALHEVEVSGTFTE